MSDKTKIQRLIYCFRRSLADYLSYAACRLRGDKWYRTSFYGLPGNRATELSREILTRVSLDDRKEIEDAVNELAQLAGENWGHAPEPKER